MMEILLKAGSISGLISLIYLIFQNLRKRPRFKFDFMGSYGNYFEKDNKRYYRFFYDANLKNQSLDPNTVTKFYLAVWANNKKNSALRYGFGELQKVLDKTSGKELILPILFSAKEAKHIELTFECLAIGSPDERLLQEVVESQGYKPPSLAHHRFFVRKHKYEVCTEDINENLFDENGQQLNTKEIGLRWTLPNTMDSLQQGNILPFIKHTMKILGVKASFQLKLITQALGIWK